MIQHPQTDEYAEFYASYIQRVPMGCDLIALLRDQPATLDRLLEHISDAQASARPAPTEWSIKEVLGHIADTERVFAYRLLCIARGDQTPLPGFDQEHFVRATDFNRRSMRSLLDEFALQRSANTLLITGLSESEIDQRGTASGHVVSARALIYMLAGHVEHHLESLQTDYSVEA